MFSYKIRLVVSWQRRASKSGGFSYFQLPMIPYQPTFKSCTLTDNLEKGIHPYDFWIEFKIERR